MAAAASVFVGPLVTAIDAWMVRRKVDQWARLIFTMIFSWWASVGCIAGGALAAHRPTGEAIGTGLVAGTVAIVTLFRKSDLTKGETVVVPEVEAKQELDSDQQTITRK
jgi:hypothetical protein